MNKFAIIGYGYWGPKVHRSLNNLGYETKYICDLKKINLPKIYNTKFTKNIDDLFLDKEIKYIVVATPPNNHYEITKLAIIHKKNVFVEKPITNSLKEFNYLESLATKNNVIIFENLVFLHSEPFIFLKKYISKKEKDVIYVESQRCNLGKIYYNNDVIDDLFHHDMSILFFLLNKSVSRCYCKLIKPKSNLPNSIAEIILEFNKNLYFKIHLSWYSPIKIRDFKIHLTNEMLHINDVDPDNKIKIYKRSITSDVRKINYRLGDMIVPVLKEKMSPLEKSLKTFTDISNKKNSKKIKENLKYYNSISKKILKIKQYLRKSSKLDKFIDVD